MKLVFGVTRHTPYTKPHHILNMEDVPSSDKKRLPIFTHIHQMQLQDALDSHNPVAYLLAQGWTENMIAGALGL